MSGLCRSGGLYFPFSALQPPKQEIRLYITQYIHVEGPSVERQNIANISLEIFRSLLWKEIRAPDSVSTIYT
jgi:hypothetical protein